MIKPQKTVKYVVKAILIGIVIGIAFLGGLYARPYVLPESKSYSEAIQFVIDNPVYAEKIYNAHKQYIMTAEELMQGFRIQTYCI